MLGGSPGAYNSMNKIFRGGISIYLNRYYSGSRRRVFFKLARFLIICLLLIFVATAVLKLPLLMPVAKDLAISGLFCIMHWGDWSGKDILRLAMPILVWEEFNTTELKSPIALLVSSISLLARVDMQSPQSLLQSQLPLMGATPTHFETMDTPEVGFNDSLADKFTVEAGGDMINLNLTENIGFKSNIPFYYDSANNSNAALVAIYNTHTSETYKLSDGVEHLTGKRGGVVKVAESMERALRDNYGINVVRSDKIHDKEYNASYLKSEKTASSLILRNPELRAVFDVHRDMYKARKQCVVEINNKEAATILIIVGSDAKSPHPEWRSNLAFARRLEEKMNEKYPGLCIGVRVHEARYHQQLHQGSLLLEIGGVNNSIEEANYSGELFSGVVAEVIMEDQTTKDV